MRLYEPLPDRVEYNGRVYRLNLAFDSVLASLDALKDENLSEYYQIKTALDNLVVDTHEVDPGLLRSVLDVISPGKEKSSEPPSIDMEQDSELIYAAFLQAYGIDLFKEQGRLHWLQFLALLQSLPSDTRMAEIAGIRQQEVPAPTKYNRDQRNQLIKLKAKYAIKSSNQLENGLYRMYQSLVAMSEQR